jgi:hypothetical protein
LAAVTSFVSSESPADAADAAGDAIDASATDVAAHGSEVGENEDAVDVHAQVPSTVWNTFTPLGSTYDLGGLPLSTSAQYAACETK